MRGRVPLTASQKRAVMIEANYRCAVPRCASPLAIDVHHIDGDSSNNSFENLIALCPTCHSAFHRNVYSLEAIKYWKLMLQQLNAAYDRNTINLLHLLDQLAGAKIEDFEVTGDGLLSFSPLLASNLIHVELGYRPGYGRGMPYYLVKLNEKGRAMMTAWKDGTSAALVHEGTE